MLSRFVVHLITMALQESYGNVISLSGSATLGTRPEASQLAPIMTPSFLVRPEAQVELEDAWYEN